MKRLGVKSMMMLLEHENEMTRNGLKIRKMSSGSIASTERVPLTISLDKPTVNESKLIPTSEKRESKRKKRCKL